MSFFVYTIAMLVFVLLYLLCSTLLPLGVWYMTHTLSFDATLEEMVEERGRLLGEAGCMEHFSLPASGLVFFGEVDLGYYWLNQVQLFIINEHLLPACEARISALTSA